MLSRKQNKMTSSLFKYLYHQPYRDAAGDEGRMMSNRLETARSLSCRDLPGHFGCVNAVEFSHHGGEWVISGGDDRRVLMWNVEKAISGIVNPISMKGQHHSNIFCLAFDPTDSKIFSGGNDEQVIVHDVKSGETTDVFSHSEAVYGISVDPVNSSVFASACDDGRILVFDIRAPPSEDPFILARYPSPMHAVVHNPVEPRLLASANAKEGICLWDIRKPRSAVLRYGGNMFQQSCMSVQFNKQGEQLIALRRRLPPVLYNLHSSPAVYQFDHPGYYNSCTMKSCCFAGDHDQYIISGSDDFSLYMWQIPFEPTNVSWVGQAHMVLKGHRSIVNQVRFNPANHLIISSGVEKIIKIWSPFRLPRRERVVAHSDEESQEEADRPVYTHEEYINLVISSGQVMTHDYSHQSTDEDPRMMAFFDSLVQRELEGWTSDDSLDSNAEIYERYVRSSESSDPDDAPPVHDTDEESGLSPFTIAFASAMASRAREEDLNLDELQAVRDTQPADQNCMPGQRSNTNRRSISDLITLKRKEYLQGVKKKELEAKKRFKRRQEKANKALAKQKIKTDSSSSSSDSDSSEQAGVTNKKRSYVDSSEDDSSSDEPVNAQLKKPCNLKNMLQLKRLKSMRKRVLNSDNESDNERGETAADDKKSQEPVASTSSSLKFNWLHENADSQSETDKESGPYLHEMSRSSSHGHSHSLYSRQTSTSRSSDGTNSQAAPNDTTHSKCQQKSPKAFLNKDVQEDSCKNVSNFVSGSIGHAESEKDFACADQSSSSMTEFRCNKTRFRRQYRQASHQDSSDDGS